MDTQMTTLSAGITLFLIMDPLGNIPFFLSLLKHVPPKRRRWVMVRELLIACGEDPDREGLPGLGPLLGRGGADVEVERRVREWILLEPLDALQQLFICSDV